MILDRISFKTLNLAKKFAKDYCDTHSGGVVQADWNETDTTANDYIKNKPTMEVSGETLVFAGLGGQNG